MKGVGSCGYIETRNCIACGAVVDLPKWTAEKWQKVLQRAAQGEDEGEDNKRAEEEEPGVKKAKVEAADPQ